MDPVTLSVLLSTALREIANMQERAAAGTITQADIDKMLALSDHTWDALAARVAAHKAAAAPV